MPASDIRKDPRTFRLVQYLARCPLETAAYGKCVSVDAERITKDACAKEFTALIKCVNRVRVEMKVQRQKRVEKRLSFYRNNFGLVEPYQLLIDGTMCAAALREGINIREQIAKYLGLGARLYTTQCVVEEMVKLGKLVAPARVIVQQFTREKCDHDVTKTTGTACLLSLAKRGFEGSPYLIGTTDGALSEQIRQLHNTPLMYISRKTVLLEAPQAAAVAAATAKQSEKLHERKECIQQLKLAVLGPELVDVKKKKKRKGKKQPNSLSVKKKSKGLNVSLIGKKSDDAKAKKTRRKRQRGDSKKDL